MTLTLADEQSQLLNVLAGQHSRVDGAFDPRGLQVYQANRAVLAERTLASTYPVLCQLIGVESFEPLARHFWQQHPPQRGDMGQWGAPLADFVDAAPQLAGEPFLGDVARAEWAMHCAATAPDAVLDAPSFALLADANGAAVTLVISPGTVTLASAYPVVSIINAHLLGQPSLSQASDLLRQGRGDHALVWRHGFKPKVRTLGIAECTLMTALLKAVPLESALDNALASESGFDFHAWLASAVQTGLITGVVQVST